jgi:hypothetical protein
LIEVLAPPAAERVRLFVLRGSAGLLAFYGKQGLAVRATPRRTAPESLELKRVLS